MFDIFRSRVLTKNYMCVKKGDTIQIHHTSVPFLFYWADRKKFLRQRQMAYEKLAKKLHSNSRFYSTVRWITGKSIWIDYEREFNDVTLKKLSLWDQFGDMTLRMLNLRNWATLHWSIFFVPLWTREYKQFKCSRKEFIQIFGKG